MPEPKRPAQRLRDLTDVETIYHSEFTTIRIKRHCDYVSSDDIELVTVTNNADINGLARAIFAGLDEDQEHFVLLVLNVSNEVTGFKVVASGAQDHVYVDAKLVFRRALLLGAFRIVVLHNHPTGSLIPSPADLMLTRKLADAGRLLDIELLDHIIWTPNEYASLAERHPRLFEPR